MHNDSGDAREVCRDEGRTAERGHETGEYCGNSGRLVARDRKVFWWASLGVSPEVSRLSAAITVSALQ